MARSTSVRTAIRYRDRSCGAGAALKRALEEKQALLEERHYRVNNNLRLVISLAAGEAMRVTDEGARVGLDNVVRRIDGGVTATLRISSVSGNLTLVKVQPG